jgi:hypothetical protein
MQRIIVLFFLLTNVLIVFGQKSYTGSVKDEHKKPLAFVSVVLLQNDQFLAGTTSDESGFFHLSFDFKDQEKYGLRFSQIGMAGVLHTFIYPDTLLKTFTLKADKNLLNDITVTAKRPLITRKSDRYIINIENSLLATGNSGLEVLQKSPGIWVNSEGVIRMKGNQSVTVMINDVVQRMNADELAEYLKTLRSEDISKIEVIQNPPAEFEASGAGGIIHIILKKARKNGLNGTVNSFNRLQGKTAFINGVCHWITRSTVFIFLAELLFPATVMLQEGLPMSVILMKALTIPKEHGTTITADSISGWGWGTISIRNIRSAYNLPVLPISF